MIAEAKTLGLGPNVLAAVQSTFANSIAQVGQQATAQRARVTTDIAGIHRQIQDSAFSSPAASAALSTATSTATVAKTSQDNAAMLKAMNEKLGTGGGGVFGPVAV